jgi:hypothetical protein
VLGQANNDCQRFNCSASLDELDPLKALKPINGKAASLRVMTGRLVAFHKDKTDSSRLVRR